MNKRGDRIIRFFLKTVTAVVGLSVTTAALGQTPYFKGNQVYLILGSGAGGGYDTYARLLARHIGDHLPGKPSIVVQNMPGAGGLKAMNYIANVAPKDGSYFGGMQSGIAYEPMLGMTGGTDNAHFNPVAVQWVGSMAKEVAVTILRNPTEIKTFEDLRNHSVTVGSSGPSTTNSVYARLMNSLFGTKLNVVEGYANQQPIYLAMERGEVQGSAGLYYSSLVYGKPDWLRDHKVSVVVQIALQKAEELPDVPLLYDLAKTEEDRQVLRLALAGLLMGHPFVLPDGVPLDRVTVIRNAFMTTMRDPEFLEEAKKMRLAITPLDGEAVTRVVAEMYATPKPVVERVRAIFSPAKK